MQSASRKQKQQEIKEESKKHKETTLKNIKSDLSILIDAYQGNDFKNIDENEQLIIKPLIDQLLEEKPDFQKILEDTDTWINECKASIETCPRMKSMLFELHRIRSWIYIFTKNDQSAAVECKLAESYKTTEEQESHLLGLKSIKNIIIQHNIPQQILESDITHYKKLYDDFLELYKILFKLDALIKNTRSISARIDDKTFKELENINQNCKVLVEDSKKLEKNWKSEHRPELFNHFSSLHVQLFSQVAFHNLEILFFNLKKTDDKELESSVKNSIDIFKQLKPKLEAHKLRKTQIICAYDLAKMYENLFLYNKLKTTIDMVILHYETADKLFPLFVFVIKLKLEQLKLIQLKQNNKPIQLSHIQSIVTLIDKVNDKGVCVSFYDPTTNKNLEDDLIDIFLDIQSNIRLLGNESPEKNVIWQTFKNGSKKLLDYFSKMNKVDPDKIDLIKKAFPKKKVNSEKTTELKTEIAAEIMDMHHLQSVIKTVQEKYEKKDEHAETFLRGIMASIVEFFVNEVAESKEPISTQAPTIPINSLSKLEPQTDAINFLLFQSYKCRAWIHFFNGSLMEAKSDMGLANLFSLGFNDSNDCISSMSHLSLLIDKYEMMAEVTSPDDAVFYKDFNPIEKMANKLLMETKFVHYLLVANKSHNTTEFQRKISQIFTTYEHILENLKNLQKQNEKHRQVLLSAETETLNYYARLVNFYSFFLIRDLSQSNVIEDSILLGDKILEMNQKVLARLENSSLIDCNFITCLQGAEINVNMFYKTNLNSYKEEAKNHYHKCLAKLNKNVYFLFLRMANLEWPSYDSTPKMKDFDVIFNALNSITKENIHHATVSFIDVKSETIQSIMELMRTLLTFSARMIEASEYELAFEFISKQLDTIVNIIIHLEDDKELLKQYFKPIVLIDLYFRCAFILNKTINIEEILNQFRKIGFLNEQEYQQIFAEMNHQITRLTPELEKLKKAKSLQDAKQQNAEVKAEIAAKDSVIINEADELLKNIRPFEYEELEDIQEAVEVYKSVFNKWKGVSRSGAKERDLRIKKATAAFHLVYLYEKLNSSDLNSALQRVIDLGKDLDDKVVMSFVNSCMQKLEDSRQQFWKETSEYEEPQPESKAELHLHFASYASSSVKNTAEQESKLSFEAEPRNQQRHAETKQTLRAAKKEKRKQAKSLRQQKNDGFAPILTVTSDPDIALTSEVVEAAEQDADIPSPIRIPIVVEPKAVVLKDSATASSVPDVVKAVEQNSAMPKPISAPVIAETKSVVSADLISPELKMLTSHISLKSLNSLFDFVATFKKKRPQVNFDAHGSFILDIVLKHFNLLGDKTFSVGDIDTYFTYPTDMKLDSADYSALYTDLAETKINGRRLNILHRRSNFAHCTTKLPDEKVNETDVPIDVNIKLPSFQVKQNLIPPTMLTMIFSETPSEDKNDICIKVADKRYCIIKYDKYVFENCKNKIFGLKQTANPADSDVTSYFNRLYKSVDKTDALQLNDIAEVALPREWRLNDIAEVALSREWQLNYFIMKLEFEENFACLSEITQMFRTNNPHVAQPLECYILASLINEKFQDEYVTKVPTIPRRPSSKEIYSLEVLKHIAFSEHNVGSNTFKFAEDKNIDYVAKNIAMLLTQHMKMVLPKIARLTNEQEKTKQIQNQITFAKNYLFNDARCWNKVMSSDDVKKILMSLQMGNYHNENKSYQPALLNLSSNRPSPTVTILTPVIPVIPVMPIVSTPSLLLSNHRNFIFHNAAEPHPRPSVAPGWLGYRPPNK